MSQILKLLAEWLEAFPSEEREDALRALGQLLAGIEAEKLAALRRDLHRQTGITNAYGWAAKFPPQGSSGGFWPAAALGLSRYMRQSGSGCRI